MPVTIYAQDNEFAAASGANIDVTPDYSYFDYPPNSTRNLTVTSNAGDDQPFLFETGETYDLTWTGNGGGGVMEDAVIIRSDYLGPGQGAIVFEGINSVNGEPFQLVWTPGFDLESWYYSNGGGPSNPNGFWTSDQNTSDSVQVACFAAGTELLTANGYSAVEHLRNGDSLQTADHGLRQIIWVFSGEVALEDDDRRRPILIQAGALGPDRPQQDLVLSAQHRVLVGAGGQLEDVFPSAAFAAAASLTGLKGIRVMRGRRRQLWFHVALAQHEVIFANGCASESLLIGPMVLNGLAPEMRQRVLAAYGASGTPRTALNGPPARPILSRKDTRNALKRANTAPEAGFSPAAAALQYPAHEITHMTLF